MKSNNNWRDEESSCVVGNGEKTVRNKNGKILRTKKIDNYEHKDIREYTREVKSGNERSITDYVLINIRNRTDVEHVRIRKGEEMYGERIKICKK